MNLQEKMLSTPAAYLQALCDQDLQAVLAFYADNAEVEDPVGSKPHIGIDAIRNFYTKVIHIGFEAQLTGQVRAAGQEVAFPFVCTNPSTGVTMNIIDVFKFNSQGQIISMRAFWGPSNAHVD